MSYGRITTETMTDIADAIREKTDSEAQLTPTQMPERIRSIQTGNPNAVLYIEQELTKEEKAQARDNIDATKQFVVEIASESDPLTANKTFAETYAAIQNGMLVRVNLWNMDSDLWLDCLYRDETQIIFGGNALGTQITLAFGSDESLTRTTSQIPTALSELSSDATHRTVTDEEKLEWNGKADTADIPSLTGYATETWVQNQGYQTAQQVQTAISGVRQLPTGGSVGDFLRKDSNGNAAWETVQTYQGGSY